MKTRVFYLVFISIIITSIVQINAFDYDQSSLREEVTEASIHIFLEEGSFHLVIDNTGYVSGEYDREETFVELEIFALNGDPEYVNDTRTLGPHYFWDIPINTHTFLIFSIHFVFNITATNPVTIFLTDEQGYYDFEEEVENFDFRKPSNIFLIIFGVLGGILVLGIVAGYFERVRRKTPRREKIRKETKERRKKPTKIKEISEIFYFCEVCKTDYSGTTKTCPKCGIKLKKIKRKLKEI